MCNDEANLPVLDGNSVQHIGSDPHPQLPSLLLQQKLSQSENKLLLSVLGTEPSDTTDELLSAQSSRLVTVSSHPLDVVCQAATCLLCTGEFRFRSLTPVPYSVALGMGMGVWETVAADLCRTSMGPMPQYRRVQYATILSYFMFHLRPTHTV